jgi:hypothetical protein
MTRVLPAGTTCQGAFTYHDPQRPHRTPFSLVFTEVTPSEAGSGAVRIAGTMTEPRFDFGPPGVQSLPSSFTGTWTPTPQGAQITFMKTYRFDDTPAEFVGTYDAAVKTVTGTWTLNGYGGGFLLTGLSTQ